MWYVRREYGATPKVHYSRYQRSHKEQCRD